MIDISKLDSAKQAEMVNLLKQSASTDAAEASVAQEAIATALQAPLRSGILVGDIISGIFRKDTFDPASPIQYPIDFYRPDNAAEYKAFVIPNQGAIPSRQVEGDYVTVPTYDVGAGIDFLARYAREARWDIVARALEVLEAGFVKKLNDDGFHVLLASAYDRNILVNDANAVAGQFTKRLVSLGKLVMRRNGGGNSASINRTKLTNLYISPESAEDIRNWGLDQVDDFTRREILTSDQDGLTSLYGVTITDLDELGEGQEYQDYYVNVTATGAANSGMASGDLEIAIGLDLSKQDSFVNPIRQAMTVIPDDRLKYQRRQGYLGFCSVGFAALNTNRSLLLSL